MYSLSLVVILFLLSTGYLLAKQYLKKKKCVIQYLILQIRLLVTALFLIIVDNGEFSTFDLHHRYMFISFLSNIILFISIYNVTGLEYLNYNNNSSNSNNNNNKTPSLVNSGNSLPVQSIQLRIRNYFTGRRVVLAELLGLIWVYSLLLLLMPIETNNNNNNESELNNTMTMSSRKRIIYGLLSAISFAYLMVNIRQRTSNLRVVPLKYDHWTIHLLTRSIDHLILLSSIIYGLLTLSTVLNPHPTSMSYEFVFVYIYLLEVLSASTFSIYSMMIITQLATGSDNPPLHTPFPTFTTDPPSPSLLRSNKLQSQTTHSPTTTTPKTTGKSSNQTPITSLTRSPSTKKQN